MKDKWYGYLNIRPIVGTYKTIWISSKTGTVYNLLRGFLALKIKLDNNGYPYVEVPCLLRRPTKILLHRILADMFIEKEDSRYTTVNHKNTLKADYSLSNLEWTTSKANVRHAASTGCHTYSSGFTRDGKYKKDVYNKDGSRKLRYNERSGYVNRPRDLSGVSARNLELESDFEEKEIWPDINNTIK